MKKVILGIFTIFTFFGLINGVEAEDFVVRCTYEVPDTSTTYMKFYIEILDENTANFYYDSLGEYQMPFQTVMTYVSKYENGADVGLQTTLGVTGHDDETIISIFEELGNHCPYLVYEDQSTNSFVRVSSTPYGDDITRFNSRLIEEEYGELAPEPEPDPTQCTGTYSSARLSEITGTDFYWLQYPNGDREFCAQTSGMTSRSCSGRFQGTEVPTVLASNSRGDSITFTIAEGSVDYFFGDTCVGNNFSIYKEAGVDQYVLTMDMDDGGFSPDDVCGEDGEECNISIRTMCNDSSVARTLRGIGIAIVLIKILVPAVIIVMGFVNLFKIITSGKEDDVRKYVKSIVIRIIVGVVIFLLPSIVNFVFEIASGVVDASGGDGNALDNCWNCVMNIDECNY